MIDTGQLGSQVGALVVDYSTGKVLFSQNADTGFTPASTTKVATAVAAIDTLGAGGPVHDLGRAAVQADGASGAGKPVITLIGGGDPTLSAGRYPAELLPAARGAGHAGGADGAGAARQGHQLGAADL